MRPGHEPRGSSPFAGPRSTAWRLLAARSIFPKSLTHIHDLSSEHSWKEIGPVDGNTDNRRGQILIKTQNNKQALDGWRLPLPNTHTWLTATAVT